MAADLPRLLLTADSVGGVWTYALDLARQLTQRGVEVHLATMGARLLPAQREAAQGIAGLHLHPSDFRLEWMQDPWDQVDRAGAWLLGLERRLAPDLVHLNQFAFGALPWRAPTLLVAHSCVLSWWQAVHGVPAPMPVWATYRSRVAAGLAGAGLVAAPTRALLATLPGHYGVQPRRRVLPIGRDPSGWMPQPKQPVVLAAGRLWDAAKNIAALDAVAPHLSWTVRVAGDITHPEGGTQTLQHLQPLGRLTPQDLAAAMGTAAIYCLPARYEPFGLSVLEAAFSGCALVLGDIPSLRETWDDAALFVPPDDHHALRRRLQGLIDDPAARAALALAARRRARLFTAQAMATACLGSYAALSPAFAEAACARPDLEPPCTSSCSATR